MGMFDLLRQQEATATTRSALEQADEHDDQGAVTRLVQSLLAVGLDGAGPLDSATDVAEKARRSVAASGRDAALTDERAIDAVVASHVKGGRIGGFVTGLGGFVTMPIALPANVFEFYVQATRMVGAIATLRGYDITEPRVRTAVLLALIGSKADDVLTKAGLATGGSRVTSLALRRLPPAALLVVNKAVGFRLIRGVGERVLSRLGRGIPLAGGLVGAGIDGYMMGRIADHARQEFPTRHTAS